MNKRKTLFLHDDSSFRVKTSPFQEVKSLLKQFLKSIFSLIFPDKKFKDFISYMVKPQSDVNPINNVQIIVKESLSDYRVQTSREALDCSNLSVENPVQILNTKLYYHPVSFQFGIFLQKHLQSYESVCVSGYYKTGNRSQNFDQIISLDTFKGLAKPTYWIDIIVDLDSEKLENAESLAVYLTKVKFSLKGVEKKKFNQPIFVTNIIPQNEKCHRKRPVIVLSFDGISASDVYNSIEDFPNLKQFASENCLYKNAITSSSVTATSAASLITGLSLPQHYIYNYEDHYLSSTLKALSPQISTIAQDLRNIGYNSEGLFTFGRWAPQYGLSRGFTKYRSVNSGAIQNFPWLEESIKALHFNKNDPIAFMMHHPGAHPPFNPRINSSFSDSEYAAY